MKGGMLIMGKPSLFRKNSLDRVSSPEQLNEYIKIVSPSLILIIIAIFSILFAGLAWIFSSNIPKYQNIPGIVIDENGKKNLYSYVDIGTSKKLSVGMESRVSPNYFPEEQYGYINGKITKIGSKTIDSNYILNKFSNPGLLAPILSSNSCIEVVTSLGEPSKLIDVSEVIEGSQCISKVVIGNEKALDFVLKNNKG